MRSDITSGIEGQLDQPGAWPGWLLEITLTNNAILRFCTFDTGFTFDGLEWVPLGFRLPDISWDGGVLRTGKLILPDPELGFWVMALDFLLTNAGARLWAAYGDVLDEAAPIWSGRLGEQVRTGITVEVELTTGSDTESSPRQRVQSVVNPVFLLPAGTILNVGGEQWKLDRSNSAAG